MWCHRCRQDVAAIALPAMKGVGCTRCGAKLTVSSPAVELEASAGAISSDSFEDVASAIGLVAPDPPQLDFDDWDCEAEWRLLDELLPAAGRESRRSRGASPIPPPVAAESWHVLHASPAANRSAPLVEQSSPSNWLAWAMIDLGAVGLIGASVAILASNLTGWELLSTVAWPALAIGQLLLVVGLTLQLDRMRQNGRNADDELARVRGQLVRLEQSTAQLRGPHGPAGQALEHRRPAGAPSSLMLADVRHQLDQLSLRLSEVER